MVTFIFSSASMMLLIWNPHTSPAWSLISEKSDQCDALLRHAYAH